MSKFKFVGISLLFVLIFVGVGCGQSAEDLRLELDDAKVSEDIMVQTETDEKIAEEQQADKQDVVEEKDQMEDERPASQVRRFDMTAKQWEFEPAVIEVYEGDTVQVNVTSIDVAHGFAINEYDIDVRIEPDETANIAFVADKKGTFTFFCSVFCGAGHGKMKGVLIVK